MILSGPLDPGGDFDDDDGPGSGQSTVDPRPCSFADWQILFKADLDGNGAFDQNDYGQWWANNHLSVDAWNSFNPGVPFTWTPQP